MLTLARAVLVNAWLAPDRLAVFSSGAATRAEAATPVSSFVPDRSWFCWSCWKVVMPSEYEPKTRMRGVIW